MAAPNIALPNTVTGRTARYAVTTTLGAALSNPSNSNQALKINSIFCPNVDGTNAADISVSLFNGTTDSYIAFGITVPADSTQIISTLQTYFWLEEGESIRAIASAAGDLVLIIGYEVFT